MSLMIVGQSPMARIVAPALLRDFKRALILAPDALGAFHILERAPVDAVIVEDGMRWIGAEGFMRLAARTRALAGMPIHRLRARGDNEPVLTLLASRQAAWAQAGVESDDLAVLAPALIACLEGAPTP